MNFVNPKKIYDNLEPQAVDLDGWGGTAPIFNELIAWIKPKIIVEVGTWKGMSAIHMCSVLKRLNIDKEAKLYCVDTWLGALEFWTYHRKTPERNLQFKNGYPQVYFQFLNNVVQTNNQDIIVPLPMTSSIGAKYLEYFKIKPQLIYIDGSHEENDVYRDLVDYWSVLENEGVIFGDDYSKHWPGVIKDVNKFCEERKLQKNIVNKNKWWIQKINA